MSDLTRDLLLLTSAALSRAQDEDGDFEDCVDEVYEDVLRLLRAARGEFNNAEVHREVRCLLAKLYVRSSTLTI